MPKSLTGADHIRLITRLSCQLQVVVQTGGDSPDASGRELCLKLYTVGSGGATIFSILAKAFGYDEILAKDLAYAMGVPNLLSVIF